MTRIDDDNTSLITEALEVLADSHDEEATRAERDGMLATAAEFRSDAERARALARTISGADSVYVQP